MSNEFVIVSPRIKNTDLAYYKRKEVPLLLDSWFQSLNCIVYMSSSPISLTDLLDDTSTRTAQSTCAVNQIYQETDCS